MRSALLRHLGLAAILALTFVCASAVAVDPSNRDAFRDARVANFHIPGTDYSSPAFERFSFRATDGGRTRIDYGYGKPYRELTLRQVPPAPGAEGFAVRFPNGRVFDIVPSGEKLVVSQRDGNYRKTFEWMYEGPVDGVGTFCAACVEEGDAIGFVRTHFAKTTQ